MSTYNSNYNSYSDRNAYSDTNNYNNFNTVQPSVSKSVKEKKWELLNGVKKGLEEIFKESNNNSEVNNLIEECDKLKEMRVKIAKQSEDLKISLLISSRERNVYLEKLRKIEEFCEEKNWEDLDGQLKEIYEILYGDN